MNKLGCQLLTIVPTEACLEWIKKLGFAYKLPLSEVKDINLDAIQLDKLTLVIPEFESLEDFEKFYESHQEEIFNLALYAWTDRKSLWPKVSYKDFGDLFEIDIQPAVFSDIDFSKQQQKESAND